MGFRLPMLAAMALACPLGLAGEPPARPDGEAVYERWCAPCHAPGPTMPGTNALAAKYQGRLPGVLLERTDLQADFVKYIVRNGSSVMPFFRKTEITDAELDALARYVAGVGGSRNAKPR